MILDKRRITVREVACEVGTSFGLCQAIFKNSLGMKHATANIIPKLLTFKQKQCRMDFTQEMLTTFNDNPDLLRKGHNWWRIKGCMAMTLKPKPNHPNDPNGSVQKCQDLEGNDVKFGEMFSFCSLFSSIAMPWCTVTSCHKIVWSIRNTTLKLCAYCAL